MRLLVAVAAAVAAAVTFAGSAVAQQRAAATAPAEESLRPRLILDLLHRRTWLLGIGGMLFAYVLQAVALGFGNVALVEPVVATELLFAVPLAIRLRRQRPGPREWAGVLAVAGGVTTFLVSADPHGGHARPPIAAWLTALLASVGAIGLLVLLARGGQTRGRAMLLGLAGGIANGMVALITKSFTSVITHGGLIAALESWQIYTVLVYGAGGFLIAQSAYQAAPLADSLPEIDSIEPLSAVLLAAGILGERISLAPVHVVVEMLGAAGALSGVILLGHSPLVLSIYEQQQEKRESVGDPPRTDSPDELAPRDGGSTSQQRESA